MFSELNSPVVEEESVWIEESVNTHPDIKNAHPDRILRERQGQYFVRQVEKRQVTRKVRQLDDDLPEIAFSFRRFVKENNLEN